MLKKLKALALGVALAASLPFTANAANIVEAAAGTRNLSTLVTAVQAADLVGTLASPGPFTVFAPTNLAFNTLPPGTLNTLLEPQNKGQLQKVLTYHVVSGNITAAALTDAIKANGGSFRFHTVSGDALTARRFGLAIAITDETGGTSFVTQPDIAVDNGVVHIINRVLLPK